jgi:flagellar assembly protein FliH
VTFPELRTGQWTRLGNDAVLGDPITEATLSTLAENTRITAGSQGYSVGWAEEARQLATETERARVRAEQHRFDEHAAAVAALERAAAQLQAAVATSCAEIESRATDLAWELTRELVGHQLHGPGIDVVRRVLALMPTEPIAAVRLHPDDLPDAVALTEHGAVLIADPSLNRGDALVEADQHVLDLRLDRALDRVREVLR